MVEATTQKKSNILSGAVRKKPIKITGPEAAGASSDKKVATGTDSHYFKLCKQQLCTLYGHREKRVKLQGIYRKSIKNVLFLLKFKFIFDTYDAVLTELLNYSINHVKYKLI